MAHDCCAHHKVASSQLKSKSILFLGAGLLSMIPMVETFFLSFGGVFLFIGLSAALFHSIAQDFEDLRGFGALNLLIIMSLFLTPLVASATVVYPLLYIQLASFMFLLFSENFMVGGLKKLKLSFPSPRKIILLFVLFNWSISCLHVIFPHLALFSFGLHDALLLLGVHHLSTYYKIRMQSSIPAHNHSAKVQVISKNGSKWISINQLQAGMKIHVHKSMLIPVATKALSKVELTDNSRENRVPVVKGHLIEANTEVHSGQLECAESYRPITHIDQHKHHEDVDVRMNLMLFISLSFAIVFGLWQGIFNQSVLTGLRVFCMNLLASCPCVFIITRPILINKFLSYLPQIGFHFNRMPGAGRARYVVFDRTHTLYEENPMNPDGPYVLNKGMIEMLKLLKERGIKCFILSGHGTGDWRKNLIACQNELKGVIATDHIIFDKKYHGNEQSCKQDVIRNLQRYGQVDKPDSFWMRVWLSIMNLIKGNHVVMVGDGGNDIKAIKQADWSVCVGKNQDSFNSNVLKVSHFFSDQNTLQYLPKLSNAIKKYHFYYDLFANLALLGNLFILATINGAFSHLFGVVVSPAMASMMMSSLCITLLFLASQVPIKPKISANKKLKPCCAKHLKLGHCCDLHDNRAFVQENVTHLAHQSLAL